MRGAPGIGRVDVEADRPQVFVQLIHLPTHPAGPVGVAIVDQILVVVLEVDHLGPVEFGAGVVPKIEQKGRGAEARLPAAAPNRGAVMVEEAGGGKSVNVGDHHPSAVGRAMISLAPGIEVVRAGVADPLASISGKHGFRQDRIEGRPFVPVGRCWNRERAYYLVFNFPVKREWAVAFGLVEVGSFAYVGLVKIICCLYKRSAAQRVAFFLHYFLVVLTQPYWWFPSRLREQRAIGIWFRAE